jgi:dihydrofolate reductase
MIVSAIVAVARGNVIGKHNKIPWYLPADLKYFKKRTLNHHVIMGRETLLSIGNPLPKRVNIVVSRNPFFTATNCLLAHSIEEALEIAYDNGEKEAFIIGGAQIFEQSMPYWDKLFLTEVELDVQGDTFFPPLTEEEWRLVSAERHEADDQNEHAYTFKVFERKE